MQDLTEKHTVSVKMHMITYSKQVALSGRQCLTAHENAMLCKCYSRLKVGHRIRKLQMIDTLMRFTAVWCKFRDL